MRIKLRTASFLVLMATLKLGVWHSTYAGGWIGTPPLGNYNVAGLVGLVLAGATLLLIVPLLKKRA